MKWAIQAKEEEKSKPQIFSIDGWTGNQRSSQMWWRNEQELLSPESRTARTSELNGSGGGRGKGIRGARPFVPVGDTNRDKRLRGPFVPVGTTNRDKRLPFCPGWFLHEFETNRKSQIIIIIISCPGWCLQPGQNSLAPLSPSLSPRPSHSAHLFLLFLARERKFLANFFTTFVKIFDSPFHPSALKVSSLFFSSSLACIAHFML